MAAGVIAEDRAWLERLDGELRGELAPVFAQASSRLTAYSCVGVLVASADSAVTGAILALRRAADGYSGYRVGLVA
jgi:hypothetical protein